MSKTELLELFISKEHNPWANYKKCKIVIVTFSIKQWGTKMAEDLLLSGSGITNLWSYYKVVRGRLQSLREKCPSTELFLVRIFLYSVWIQENTDQK